MQNILEKIHRVQSELFIHEEYTFCVVIGNEIVLSKDVREVTFRHVQKKGISFPTLDL
jgi:hypothetical protein